jgi:hypothetical protein
VCVFVCVCARVCMFVIVLTFGKLVEVCRCACVSHDYSSISDPCVPRGFSHTGTPICNVAAKTENPAESCHPMMPPTLPVTSLSVFAGPRVFVLRLVLQLVVLCLWWWAAADIWVVQHWPTYVWNNVQSAAWLPPPMLVGALVLGQGFLRRRFDRESADASDKIMTAVRQLWQWTLPPVVVLLACLGLSTSVKVLGALWLSVQLRKSWQTC